MLKTKRVSVVNIKSDKPILRWVLGHCNKHSLSVLNASIKSAINFYESEFNYFVLYNEGVEEEKLGLLKNKYKNVNFLKQDWANLPFNLNKPSHLAAGRVDQAPSNQVNNGSFWKLCPPRLSLGVHEILLDNDVVFLKRPALIDEFLSRKDKNLITEDTVSYNGSFEKYLGRAYNAGIVGLRPEYDFEKDLLENYELIDQTNESYAEEQGLTIYTLYKTDPLIGSCKDFVGLHCDKIFSSNLKKHESEMREDYYLFGSRLEPWDTRVLFEVLSNKNSCNLLNHVFSTAESIHFLGVNRREKHFGWNFFKSLKKC